MLLCAFDEKRRLLDLVYLLCCWNVAYVSGAPRKYYFIGACWFHVTKKKRNKGKKEGGDEQGRATFQQCAKNGHGNDHLTWRGVLACCFFWMRHVYSS